MTGTSQRTLTPGAYLKAAASGGVLSPFADLWGFGGLHGGLSLALMAGAMAEHAPCRTPQSATARFHRSITEPFLLETALGRTGRLLSTATARVSSGRGLNADATAVFSAAGRGGGLPEAPPAPAAPPPGDCEIFTVLPEFVPVTTHLEIRPVGPGRPYAGGTEPVLTAWIRMTEDDAPPDAFRLMFLADALAPSYAAVLTEPVAVPTVELTVRPGPGLARASSPWILLRAVTHAATPDGWIDERLDAWGPDGVHLGSAHQVRVVRTG